MTDEPMTDEETTLKRDSRTLDVMEEQEEDYDKLAELLQEIDEEERARCFQASVDAIKEMCFEEERRTGYPTSVRFSPSTMGIGELHKKLLRDYPDDVENCSIIDLQYEEIITYSELGTLLEWMFLNRWIGFEDYPSYIKTKTYTELTENIPSIEEEQT